MTSSVVASESGVFVHGQYILSTSLSDPSSNQWAKNLLFSNSSCPPRLKGERYLNWVPRNRSTVQIQSSAVKAYTIYLVPTIPWIKQDNIDQASLRFQDLLSTFLQVLDHFWLIGVLKTCKILSDFIQVLRFAILRFRVPFSNFSFQASSNSERILLYVESRTTNFRVIRIFYVLLRILRIFRFACIFICFSTSFPTIRFDSFPTIWFDSFPTIWFDYFRRLDSIIILFYDLIRFLFRLIPTIRLRELFQSFRKPPRRDQFAIICILYFRHIVRGLPSPHLTWFSTIFWLNTRTHYLEKQDVLFLPFLSHWEVETTVLLSKNFRFSINITPPTFPWYFQSLLSYEFPIWRSRLLHHSSASLTARWIAIQAEPCESWLYLCWQCWLHWISPLACERYSYCFLFIVTISLSIIFFGELTFFSVLER